MRTVAASLDEQNASNAQMSETVLAMHNLTGVVTGAVEQQRSALENVVRLAAELEAAAQQGVDAAEDLGTQAQRLHGELNAPQVAPLPLLAPAWN
ncbi:MAG: hypothetical protein KGM44_09465, partial [bacterium]|nr:hypothetical protein [bacterium]